MLFFSLSMFWRREIYPHGISNTLTLLLSHVLCFSCVFSLSWRSSNLSFSIYSSYFEVYIYEMTSYVGPKAIKSSTYVVDTEIKQIFSSQTAIAMRHLLLEKLDYDRSREDKVQNHSVHKARDIIFPSAKTFMCWCNLDENEGNCSSREKVTKAVCAFLHHPYHLLTELLREHPAVLCLPRLHQLLLDSGLLNPPDECPVTVPIIPEYILNILQLRFSAKKLRKWSKGENASW